MSTDMNVKEHTESLGREGRKIALDASTSPMMENLIRVGYVTRGLIYSVIGLLALQTILGGGGILTDSQGAIALMGQTVFGKTMLYLILVGLLGYGLWGFIRAMTDPLHKGKAAKVIAARVGYVISGLSYILLALGTYRLISAGAVGAPNGTQTAQTQSTVGTVLAQPWGAWLVGVVAIVIIGIGLSQIYQGLQQKFDRQFSPYALSTWQRKWITRLGQIGMTARGLVFALIGVFMVWAAYTKDPSRAQGIDGVLTTLLRSPAGFWWLGFVALGLMAFGIYSIASGVLLRLKR
jgi:hypothetical protein